MGPKYGNLPFNTPCPSCGLGGPDNPLTGGFKLKNHLGNERCQALRRTREFLDAGMVAYPDRGSSISDALMEAVGGARAFTCTEVGGLRDKPEKYTNNIQSQVWVPAWVRIVTESPTFDTWNYKNRKDFVEAADAIRDSAIVRLHENGQGAAIDSAYRLGGPDQAAFLVADLCPKEAEAMRQLMRGFQTGLGVEALASLRGNLNSLIGEFKRARPEPHPELVIADWTNVEGVDGMIRDA